MYTTRLAQVLFAALVVIPLANAQTLTYGDSVAIGNGRARTWVEVDDQDVPLRIGVTLTEGAFSNLPPTPREHSLELPRVASDSFFQHVLFDWNPSGHPPFAVYDLPHFDFHFYMIPRDERILIPAGPDPIPVPPMYMPRDYIPIEGNFAVPQMGVHYADQFAPELNGEVFTTTMIYGFYQAEMLFVEPMITRAYLLTQPAVSHPVKQPDVYQVSAYYPTTYHIDYDAQSQTTSVFIADFVLRQGVPIAAEGGPASSEYGLRQNAPNPFNSSTTIAYDVPQASHVRLEIFDLLGRSVATLVDEVRPAGTHSIAWEVDDHASGVYVYRLSSGAFTHTRRMLLLRNLPAGAATVPHHAH
jgi:hypothetical protein